MISVVIPNYNGAKYLKSCFKSIKKNSLAPGEIIVVDNGSTDNSVNLICRLFPQTIIIKNPKNFGFAKAANQGIIKAKSKYVALINNDLVLDKNWLKIIADSIDKTPKGERVAAWCGKTLTADGKKIENVGLRFSIRGKAENIGNGEISRPQKYDRERYVFGASGAAVVYRKEAFLSTGMFDEDFFCFEEDVDLSLRLQAQKWKTKYLPQAISYHVGGATISQMGNRRQRLDFRNWCFILLKHYPAKLLISRGLEITVERLRNLSWLIRSSSWHRLPWDLGVVFLSIVVKLPKMLKKRKPLPIEEIADK